MALPILVHSGLLYQDLIRKGEVGRGEELPAVFPLLICNGREPWGAARDVGEPIDQLPGNLKCYRPMNRYLLLEEASIDEAHRADESNTVGGIIRIEKSGGPAEIRRAVARLRRSGDGMLFLPGGHASATQRTPCCRPGTGIQAEHRRSRQSTGPDAAYQAFRHGATATSHAGRHGSGPARLWRRGVADPGDPLADSARRAC
jgi:hypothetical protein